MGAARTCTVLGVEYFVGDVPAATATVLDRVESGLGGYSCLCGVHGIITAQHSESMMGALDEAWLNFPDGAPVAWLMRRHGAGDAHRVAGPDLMPRVVEAGQEHGIRHFLFGSSPEVLAQLERRLVERFPRAIIAGSISPPFREVTDAETEAFADRLRQRGVEVAMQVYPDAPHSFFDRTFAEHREDCADAWHQMLAFVDRYAV